MCQSEVVGSYSKGAVHGRDCTHFHRHVEECPGANISHDDDGYMAPEITDKALRRRPNVEQAHDNFRETIGNIEKYRAAQQQK